MKQQKNWPPVSLTKEKYEKMSKAEQEEWVKAMEERGKEILSEEKLDGETNEEFFKRITGLEDEHEAKKKYFQKIATKTGIGNIEKEKVVFGNAAHMQAGTEYDKKKEVLEKKENNNKENFNRIKTDIEDKIMSYKDKVERGKEDDARQLLEQIKFDAQELGLSSKEKDQIEEEIGESLRFTEEEFKKFITKKLEWADTPSLYTEVENRLASYVNFLEKGNEDTAKQTYDYLEKIISSLPAGKVKAELAGEVLEVLATKGEIDALKIDKDGNLVRDELLKGGEAERFKNLNTELIQAKAEIENLKEEKKNEEDGRVENSPENEDDGSDEKNGGSTTSTTTTTTTPTQSTTLTKTQPAGGNGEQPTTPNLSEQTTTSSEQNPTEGGENGNGGAETTLTTRENQPQRQESVENSDQLTLGERINQRIGVLSVQLGKVENTLENIQEGEEIELILDGQKQNFTKETLEAKQKELQEKIEILEKRLELWNEKERINKNLKNIEKVLKENKGEDLEKKVLVEIDGEEKEMTLGELYRLKDSLEEEKAGLLTQNIDAYNQEKDLEVKGFWGKLWNGFKNLSWVKQWNGLSNKQRFWWKFAIGTAATTAAVAATPAAAGMGILSLLGKTATVRAGTMAAAWVGSGVAGKTSDFWIGWDLNRLKDKKEKLLIENNLSEAEKVEKDIKALEGRRNKWNIFWGLLGGMAAGMGARYEGNSLVGAGSSTPEVKANHPPIHEASTGTPTETPKVFEAQEHILNSRHNDVTNYGKDTKIITGENLINDPNFISEEVIQPTTNTQNISEEIVKPTENISSTIENQSDEIIQPNTSISSQQISAGSVQGNGESIKLEDFPKNFADQVLKELDRNGSTEIYGQKYIMENLGGKNQLLDQAGNLIAEDKKLGFLGKLFGQSENKNIKLALEKIAQGKNIG